MAVLYEEVEDQRLEEVSGKFFRVYRTGEPCLIFCDGKFIQTRKCRLLQSDCAMESTRKSMPCLYSLNNEGLIP